MGLSRPDHHCPMACLRQDSAKFVRLYRVSITSRNFGALDICTTRDYKFISEAAKRVLGIERTCMFQTRIRSQVRSRHSESCEK